VRSGYKEECESNCEGPEDRGGVEGRLVASEDMLAGSVVDGP